MSRGSQHELMTSGRRRGGRTDSGQADHGRGGSMKCIVTVGIILPLLAAIIGEYVWHIIIIIRFLIFNVWFNFTQIRAIILFLVYCHLCFSQVNFLKENFCFSLDLFKSFSLLFKQVYGNFNTYLNLVLFYYTFHTLPFHISITTPS